MTIQNVFLKNRTERAIELQQQGCFIVDHSFELPLPPDKSLSSLQFSRERDEQGRYYDYQNSWGFFSRDASDRNLLLLRKGSPPTDLVPQPPLSLATATMHLGYVAIHNNGSSFEMDIKTPDKVDWSILSQVNEILKVENIPIVIWQIDEAEGEKPPVIRITNDSAMLFASSAIWDVDQQQLVAAHTVTTSHELLKAVKATLANNSSKSYLSIKSPDGEAFLKGAKRGFINISNNLTPANADGVVTAMLHPLSGDPQSNAADYFYLVVAPGEKVPEKFSERLDQALPWPIKKEWAEYLLEAGQIADLVYLLPGSGKDFTAGFRVIKNEAKWQQVISSGLRSGRITI